MTFTKLAAYSASVLKSNFGNFCDINTLILHIRPLSLGYADTTVGALLRNDRGQVVMVALCNRADHYIFILFLLPFFFFSSPNLSGRRLDVYHTLAHGVALVRI